MPHVLEDAWPGKPGAQKGEENWLKVFRLPPTLPKGNVTSAFVCNWNPRQAGTAAFAASFVMEYEWRFSTNNLGGIRENA